MEIGDYKVVIYRQSDGSWAAYAPAVPGCHAIMPTREEALAELESVFDMIREEWEAQGKPLPNDVELTHA